jgi:DNA-binding CsgD family transcriptional regulator
VSEDGATPGRVLASATIIWMTMRDGSEENRHPETPGAGPTGPERPTGNAGTVSPLFGRGAILAMLVWGIAVLGVTGGIAIAGTTPLWPLLPVLGAAVPLMFVFLAVQHAKNQGEALRVHQTLAALTSDDRAEREVLGELLQSDGLTPARAASRTSLSLSQASEVLERLAGKGHLDVAARDGNLVYALRDGNSRSSDATGAVAGTPEPCEEGRPEPPPSVVPPIEPLSERELEVMRLLASGRTNREISHELYVSHGTTKAHTANIYRKLDAHNRAEMINRAKTLGLLD